MVREWSLAALTVTIKNPDRGRHFVDESGELRRCKIMIGGEFVARGNISPREPVEGGVIKIFAITEQERQDAFSNFSDGSNSWTLSRPAEPTL